MGLVTRVTYLLALKSKADLDLQNITIKVPAYPIVYFKVFQNFIKTFDFLVFGNDVA